MKFVYLILLPLTLLSAEAKKPNILFLLSDDQGWGDYGFMGHPHIETPAIDALAASGLTFRHGYTPAPLCRPSLASILTGLHPHEHGITGNDPSLPPGSPNAFQARALPEYADLYSNITKQWQAHPNWVRSLKANGYRSLQTGKWWEGNPIEHGDFTQGMTIGSPEKNARHGDVGLKIGRNGLQPIKEFIQKPSEEPWFIWYGVFLPHTPHNPPQELLDKYLAKTDSPSIAAYWACCEWLDQTIGELMAFLKESGELENTLIIYTCDNGWIQDPKTNRFASRSKRTAYEGGIRTPIIFSWKDRIIPRMDTENLASNLDIWPTAAALCGTSTPNNLTGINLINFSEVENRNAIYGASYKHDIMQHDVPLKSLKRRFVIENNWKLLSPNPLLLTEAKPELFNLEKDPHEKENLAEKHPRKVQALTKLLDAWWKPEP